MIANTWYRLASPDIPAVEILSAAEQIYPRVIRSS
jgi:hypothetical protein